MDVPYPMSVERGRKVLPGFLLDCRAHKRGRFERAMAFPRADVIDQGANARHPFWDDRMIIESHGEGAAFVRLLQRNPDLKGTVMGVKETRALIMVSSLAI
jgi:hypothetical protein